MDIFEKRYFSFNKKLFVLMGLWPFGFKAKNIRKYVLLSVLFLGVWPHVISAIVNVSDVDRTMLNLVSFFILFLMFLKVLSLVVSEGKMIGLYRTIANNWLAIVDEREREILVEYSERGRKKTIYYFILVQIGGSSVFALPTIPKILDIISPLPQPREKLYILEGELFIDKDKYYLLHYFLDAISVAIGTIVSVSVDTMYIICVKHCCALYAVIRYRLRNIGSTPIVSSRGTEINPYDYVIDIIRLHQNTLKFTKTINKAFSLLFLYILIANIPCIPLLAVTVLTNFDEPYNCLRFGTVLVLLGVHLFMLFWPGQNILDHGTELVDDAYCNGWYNVSYRTRKMVAIFMIRCSQPILLTAGGLMLMNFVTFLTIGRTAVSYITVVASFR